VGLRLPHAGIVIAGVCLSACVATPTLPDWALSLEFQDATSCSKLRRVEVFESGHVLYFSPAAPQPGEFEIGSSGAAELVQLAKSFPMVAGGYLEDFVGSYPTARPPANATQTIRQIESRGSNEDLQRLIAAVEKRSGISWESVQLPAGEVCQTPEYKLPAGTIALREDLQGK